jgi:hypothetical protein
MWKAGKEREGRKKAKEIGNEKKKVIIVYNLSVPLTSPPSLPLPHLAFFLFLLTFFLPLVFQGTRKNGQTDFLEHTHMLLLQPGHWHSENKLAQMTKDPNFFSCEWPCKCKPVS